MSFNKGIGLAIALLNLYNFLMKAKTQEELKRDFKRVPAGPVVGLPIGFLISWVVAAHLWPAVLLDWVNRKCDA